MKIIITSLLLLAAVTHSETNLYHFSGNCVVVKGDAVSKNLTADEILNLPNAIKHPFAEFYFFDDGGSYGVTNWSRFPNSQRMVGSEFEFQVDVSRRVIDNGLYFSKARYRFRFFDEWDAIRNQPTFIHEGLGFSIIPVGRNYLFRGAETSRFIIVRIDKISTHHYQKVAARNPHIVLIDEVFHSLNTQSGNLLKQCNEVTSNTTKMSDGDWEDSCGELKNHLTSQLNVTNLKIDDLSISYIGNDSIGNIVLSSPQGNETRLSVVKIDGEWKLKN